MHRPGFLNGFEGMAPRNNSLGAYASSLGSFGKGMMAPPPSPGPAAGIPSGGQPPQFIEGKWQCSGSQPPSAADGYFYCCPETGWTKVGFEDARPCGDNYGQIKCGPLPGGATTEAAVCCENLTEWVARGDGSTDPCLQAALATGRAVPGVTQTILDDDLMVDQGPLISPVVMIAGGLAIAVLFIATIVIKLKS